MIHAFGASVSDLPRRMFGAAVAVVVAALTMTADADEIWTVVDLHPPLVGSYKSSQAYGVGGGQQAGYASVGTVDHAYLWSGTPESWVDLNPSGAASSQAFGVAGGQQVGKAVVGGVDNAGMWLGTAASWVNLSPTAGTWSYAYGVGGGQQVGQASLHAYLWTGTAGSGVDLNPTGASQSVAQGVSGGQQVGFAYISNAQRAGLWTGTAASWVDLNPAVSTRSYAYGASGGRQVGQVTVDGLGRACVWSGTADSWVDLHAFLPSQFTTSVARGIWNDAGFTYVVGYGYNNTDLRNEALMWVVPEPASGLVLTAGLAAFALLRRRK